LNFDFVAPDFDFVAPGLDFVAPGLGIIAVDLRFVAPRSGRQRPRRLALHGRIKV
jgi:hypothetical protein